VALGGRVAEELRFGEDEVTTGASNDLQRVAGVARRMVTQWGFGKQNLGSTAWETTEGSGFGLPKMASEATQERIDVEVEGIVAQAYNHCKEKLSANREALDEFARELIRKETMDRAEITGLLKNHGCDLPYDSVYNTTELTSAPA
jgi:cell division protease FtsH